MRNPLRPDDQKKPLPQTIYASILLALICSVICIAILGALVLINWNNPLWDAKIKLIAAVVIVITVGIAGFFGWLIRKRIR